MFSKDQVDKNKLIEQTQAKYSELYDEDISYEEAVDIINSLRDYSEVLIEIYEENKELFHQETGIPLQENKKKDIPPEIDKIQPEIR